MSPKIKEEKKKEKEKEKKRKKKEKEKEENATLCLETRARSEGYMRKPLKPGALSQLVGNRRLCARYTGGWVEFSKL